MDFMINYHLYRQVFPVTALGRARCGERPALAQRRAAGRQAATRAHDENFPVAFLLAPRDVRADMRDGLLRSAARPTTSATRARRPGDRLAALDAWEDDLRRAVGGGDADAAPGGAGRRDRAAAA